MGIEHGLYADRSERGKLRISGPQRAWFLDQILTQKFEDMQPGEARDAAMITVHGRMTAYLEVLATDDAFLCHFEPELHETLPEALSGYVFATRVEIDDVSDGMGLVLVAGENWTEVAAKAPIQAPVHSTRSLGVPGAYLWVDGDRIRELIAYLRSAGLGEASEEELEALRIGHGVPRWGHDMDLKTFPQEAGIDDHALHYEKGCYLGQEAMAKIHFRGKVNRRLAPVQGAEALEAGAQVFAEGGGKIGVMTSASGRKGLAMVRHTAARGARVLAGEIEAELVG